MKITFLIFLSVLVLIFLPKLSYAQSTTCSCAPNANYGPIENKNAWCTCAYQCGDGGSLTRENCPQAAQSDPCKTSCSSCSKVADKCGNTTYTHCDYSSCSASGANPDTTYTCFSDVNPNCQGAYRCGDKCAPTSAPPPSNPNPTTPKSNPTVQPPNQLIAPTQPSAQPSMQPPVNPSVAPSGKPLPKKPVRIIVTQSGQPAQTLDPSAINMNEAKVHLNFDANGVANVQFEVDYDYFGKDIQSYYMQYKLKRQPAKDASPAENQTQSVKVLVLKYYPLDNSKNKLDLSITNLNTDLPSIRSYVDNLTQQGLQKLTEASRYHGYKTNSQPALNYTLIDGKEFLQAIPVSDYIVPWSQSKARRPDYRRLLKDVGICNYVDNKGVSQVWVWGYHTSSVEPAESNMSMGTDSEAFWNFDNYGDVSNSERINDMPICKKTYTLYNYNYQRGLGELLEDHGHHMEQLMRFVDNDLFWNKWVKPNGDKNGVNHCGWVHSPPNVDDDHQYDWTSKISMQSDCEDWKPDGGASIKNIDCTTWSGQSCINDMGASYKVWWFQNIPGLNNGLTYQGKTLRNWWAFYGDFDAAIASGKSLVVDSDRARLQSVEKSSVQSDSNYVPPASLPHPSYTPVTIPAVISTPQPTLTPTSRPASVPTPTPKPLKLIDFNHDGVINVFDYAEYGKRKLGF